MTALLPFSPSSPPPLAADESRRSLQSAGGPAAPLPGEGGRGPHPCLRGFRALSPKAQAFALTPAERATLLRDGSIRSICPSRPRLSWVEHARAVKAAAVAYWAAPARPHGLIKSLCIDHGLDPSTEDYRAVLQAIERLRQLHRVA